jgi:hypothetical protein
MGRFCVLHLALYVYIHTCMHTYIRDMCDIVCVHIYTYTNIYIHMLYLCFV